MTSPLRILFTAFEPSGDQLVKAIANALRNQQEHVEMFALAGAHAEAAGVCIIENTTEHSAMLAGAAAQVLEHKRRLKNLENWLKQNPIDILVPVDSPAANWSICKLVRKTQPSAKIIHMVLPQIWAWAPWRIHKLRRLTDHVMCMLPFEPAWLEKRNAPGSFIGHPLFDPPPSRADYEKQFADWPGNDAVKLALLPGSRKGEIDRNFPLMIQVLAQLKQRHPNLHAIAAMTNEKAKQWAIQASEKAGGLSHVKEYLDFELGKTDAVLAWADVALVVSGTATLQTAAHGTPMVTCFEASKLQWLLLGQFLIRTRTFTLPNLIVAGGPDAAAGCGKDGHIVPEFIPHFGEIPPVVEAVNDLIVNSGKREKQVKAFDQIRTAFANKCFGLEAAKIIRTFTMDH